MRVFLALLLLAPAAQESGDVRGRVTLAPGAAPKKRVKVNYKGPGMSAHKAPSASPFVVWLEGPTAPKAEGKTVDMLQEGIEFRPKVLAVRAGTTVRFPNGDEVQHNVMSFSKAKPFDLGRFPKGQSKDVVFDQAGVVEIICEVHPHMRGFVVVVDHPWFAVANDDGSYVLPKVPPGAYTLVAWKEDFEPVRRPIEVGAGGAAFDVQIARAGDPDPDQALACCAR
jgi:plastocyanin